MNPTYTYTKSADYISSLDFDYIETYSFQRGEEYDHSLQQLKEEYNRLQARKKRGKDISGQEAERCETLYKLVGISQYLIDKEGNFHASCKKINTFNKGHKAIEKIKQILLTEAVDVPSWLCAPVYRDAIVFYDRHGSILSVLNICFSCEYMETKMFHHIKGDVETYKLLKHFLTDAGHEIEA